MKSTNTIQLFQNDEINLTTDERKPHLKRFGWKKKPGLRGTNSTVNEAIKGLTSHNSYENIHLL